MHDENTNPNIEVQDIFRQFAPAYLQSHKLPLQHLKVASAISFCRTSKLGAHTDCCDECGHTCISYNSCRNRHCPKCQGLAREQWLLDRQQDLLPVPYFHVVFTLPDLLNPLVLRNQKLLYDLLFQCVSETLSELAADKKYLEAQIGFTSILHTWGQNLMDHPHIHCIVPGGGLSFDGLHWINSRKKFFIPVKVLSKKFRGKFLYHLKQLYAIGSIGFHGKIAALAKEDTFKVLINQLYEKNWVVYCKMPFKSPLGILSNRNRQSKLLTCKKLTGVNLSSIPKKLTTVELLLKLTGRDVTLCPCCQKGHMRRQTLQPIMAVP